MQKLSSKECFSWLRNYAVLILLLLPLVVLAAGPTQRITGDLAVSGSVRVGLENVTPLEGMVAYDSVNHELAVYNGTAWQKVFDAANLTGTLPPGLLHCSDLADATGSCSTANASASTPSTLVARDASGNFSAGTVTAALTGVASGNLKATANNHGILISSGTNTATVLAPDASTTKILTSGGTGADPTWQPSPVSMPTTTLGDIPYEDATPAPARLPGNITTTKKFLTQTGNGSISAAPGWNTIAAGDVPTLNQNTTGTAAGNLSGTPSNHGMLISSGTNAVTVLAPDASTTKVWTSGGVSADPSWQPPAGGLLGPGSSTSTAFARWNGTAGTTLQDSVFLGASTGILTTTGDTAGMTMASVTDTTASGSLAIDHNSTSLLLKSLESSTNAGYSLGLSTATIAGSNANGTGAINLTTGDKSAGTGNSGGITLTTGATTGGARGRITFADGSEGNAPGAVWTVSGNSGSGHWVSPSEKNYIANPDANIQSASTTPAGWANYFDAAGTAPVDCTGGSPVTALTRNTSSPIGPTTDFRWTKSATSRQGEGFSYDFTIDKTDQAKVMKVAFDYSVASGTFVPGTPTTDSDMTVWLFDITNGVLIQPSTYKLFSSTTSPPAGFDTTFQTNSNSTSYRLCVHTGTTSASAYTLAFRNFEAKRARYTYGTPGSDWISYTPTITGAGTPTGIEMWWRRNGPNLEIEGRFTTGTTTATEARLSFPTGLSTSAINPATIRGVGSWYSGTTTTTTYKSVLAEPSVSYFTFGINATAVAELTKEQATSIWSNAQVVSIKASVPIQGWSSTVQMSDSAPTTLVSYSGTGNTTVNNTTVTLTPTTTFDTTGSFVASTWTCPTQGKYNLVTSLRTGSVTWTAGQAIELYYVKNGGAQTIMGRNNMAAGGFTAQALGYAQLDLKAGDTLVFKAYSDVSNTGTFIIDINRQSSPVSIGRSEDVNGKYTTTNTNSTATGVDTTIANWTKVYDSASIFNPTTGVGTFNSPGKYHIACSLITASAAFTVGSSKYALAFLNGTKSYNGRVQTVWASITTLMSVGFDLTDDFKAGDTFNCNLSNRTGSTLTLDGTASGNSISWERVGF